MSAWRRISPLLRSPWLSAACLAVAGLAVPALMGGTPPDAPAVHGFPRDSVALCLSTTLLLLSLWTLAQPRVGRLPAVTHVALTLAFVGLTWGVLELELEWLLRARGSEFQPSATLFWELAPNRPPHNNRWGLHSADLPLKPAPGELRVVALGDSTVWNDIPADGPPPSDASKAPSGPKGKGTCDGRFSNLLEARLHETYPTRSIRVINGAVAGYSSLQLHERLRTQLMAFSPNLLIVGTNSDFILEPQADKDRLPTPAPAP